MEEVQDVLDFCEFFAGSGRLSGYVAELGCAAAKLDISYSRHMDLLTSTGMLLALSYIRRVRRGGHVACFKGCPCFFLRSGSEYPAVAGYGCPEGQPADPGYLSVGASGHISKFAKPTSL